jgi:DNA-binding XRE family transcriptional regulator
MSKKKTVKKKHFNNKVAANRGAEWVTNIKKGKMESRANPSKLSEIRVGKGLRQIDIAQRLQMSLPTYCAVERGKRLIKDIMAKHIAAELGVKLGVIFEPPTREVSGGIKWQAVIDKSNKKGA